MRWKTFAKPQCFALLFFAMLYGPIPRSMCETPGDHAPYNVILITPDQLRADYMHTYGYPLPDTPNIDRLASQGTVFLRAYTEGSWTTPSFGSLLTGLFPVVHGMMLPPYLGCGPSITRPMIAGSLPNVPPFISLSLLKPILPELLKKYGFTTAADDANCWSFWDVAHRGWDSFKFFAGWQLINPAHPEAEDPFYNTAPGTLSWAQQWLSDHKGQRFFLWVHFMEPHSPYNPPREYDRFHTYDDFPDLYEDNHKGWVKLHSYAALGNPHAIRRMQELYSAKILYVDHYIGELINTIHSLGLDGNTIVILTSDHGELLYSHPKDYNTTDHISLYDANTHIPMIVRGPGVPAGRRLNTLVSHYDIVPSILDLENLPPPAKTNGVSFKQVLLSGSPEPNQQIHDYLYAGQVDLTPEFSVRNTRYKLIERLRDGNFRCFDDLTDPGELHSVCDQIPTISAQLKAALDLHLQTVIREAKAYPDWKDNVALAVIEQRDSRGLLLLAPRNQIVWPGSGTAMFQLNGRGLWSISGDSQDCEGGLCYWAPPGVGKAFAIWRSEMPMTGSYEIYYKYGDAGSAAQPLAKNASITVKFRGGSLSYQLNQNQKQGQWVLVGRVDNPSYVKLTNLADGPVVAGTVRFLRIGN